MRIALTGATGFVGSTLMDLALEEGHELSALTRREQDARLGVTWVRGDLADHAALQRLADGCDAAIHVAGVVNVPDRAAFEAGNIDGTRAMVQAATAAGVPRFVHVSSLAAREPALSDYGWSKAGAEAEAAGARGCVMVRPPAIYGPRDTEMFELFRAARSGVVPLPPRGRASMIHVADLVRLLLVLATGGGVEGAIYEADDGHPDGWTHEEMARMIGAAVGRRIVPIHMPRGLVGLAASIDRGFRGAKAKLTPDRARYMCHPDWTAHADRQPPASLWEARIPTPEGLRQTAEWYRTAGWL